MDLGTAATAAIIILIGIVPFIVLIRNGSKKKKHFLQALFALSEKNNCRITSYNVWSTLAIGIDAAAGIAFFFRKTKSFETFQQADLAVVEKCRLINVFRTISTGDGNFEMIDKLQVTLTHRDKNKEEIVFEFFSAAEDGHTITGERHLAEKWCKILNETVRLLNGKDMPAKKQAIKNNNLN